MAAYKIFIPVSILAFLLFTSCEQEKTEYKSSDNSETLFYGFSDYFSNIIIHDESLSYYSQKSKKVFSNLFEYRNGRKLGKGIHSYKYANLFHHNKIIGVITVESENRVEIIDAKNFVSLKQISLESPRDIAIINDQYVTTIFISCGNSISNGKLAVIVVYNYADNNTFDVTIEIGTGNIPGKIFIHDYIYVLPHEQGGSNTIAKIYRQNFDIYSFQKVDDIYVGENPVSFVGFSEGFSGHSNYSLAILCKGNASIPASIVNFDLVLNKIISEHSLETFEFLPEKIVRLSNYSGKASDEIWLYANSRIYNVKLSQLEKPVVVFNRNISDLTRLTYPITMDDNYMAVSRDTVNEKSKLYLLRLNPPSVFDSITINGHAKKIESPWSNP
jgi:hypothetical protein